MCVNVILRQNNIIWGRLLSRMRFLWHCWQSGRALLAKLERGAERIILAPTSSTQLVGCGGEDACRAPNPAAEAFYLRHSLLLCSCSRRSCSVYTTQSRPHICHFFSTEIFSSQIFLHTKFLLDLYIIHSLSILARVFCFFL